MWGETAPAGARNALYGHLTRIRHLLARTVNGAGPPATGPRLHRVAEGYRLDLAGARVDLREVEELLRRARRPDAPPGSRAALLRDALSRWHGEALAGVPGRWAENLRTHLSELRIDTVVAWARAELALGGHDAVIREVRPLLAEHPRVEPLAAVMIASLHSAGRGAEALALYETVRRHLADDLGADPGPELQEAHRLVLRGGTAPRPRPTVTHVVPAQLPPGTYGFAGRSAELVQLDETAHRAGVRIAVISGTAGVGKTALAVHWARGVADRFPDGQFFLDLRGFSVHPSASAAGPTPMTVPDAVRGMLDALGVPGSRIPAGVDGQVALYRSLLATRRMLVVLDNARDEQQVRPLLPGSAGCAVIVTSRLSLTGLVAADTWDTMGFVVQGGGRAAEAISWYRRAADLHRDIGDRYAEARNLRHLGNAEAATGDGGAARRSLRRALEILRDLGHDDADGVLAELNAPDLSRG